MSARTQADRELEAITRLIGKQIADEMSDAASGRPIGFFLMLFDFGEQPFSSYISNAQRDDMIRALREQADRLEAGMANTAGDA